MADVSADASRWFCENQSVDFKEGFALGNPCTVAQLISTMTIFCMETYAYVGLCICFSILTAPSAVRVNVRKFCDILFIKDKISLINVDVTVNLINNF